MRRQRLDLLLVSRGMVPTRAAAAAAIDEGRVLVDGAVADKASRQVAPGDPIVVRVPGQSFVSRGGKKLERALERFDLQVDGRSAIDAGSATGGFTDCLLQSGAAGVLAVDVGYGQLHERLRRDARVVSLERTNIRDLSRQRACELLAPAPQPSVVTSDLSFTSVTSLAPLFLTLVGDDGDLIVLCKPQFEVGRAVAARNRGVIRKREERHQAIEDVIGALRHAGAAIMGVVSSPVLGPAGNAEFLIHAATTDAQASAPLSAQIDAALDEAEAL